MIEFAGARKGAQGFRCWRRKNGAIAAQENRSVNTPLQYPDEPAPYAHPVNAKDGVAMVYGTEASASDALIDIDAAFSSQDTSE
jgi:hypothetical protein